MRWLILITLLFSVGCVTKFESRTENGDVVIHSDSGTKANASLQASIYSRGGTMDSEASEGSATGDEAWTDSTGGGQVSATTSVDSEGDQAIDVAPLEPESDLPVEPVEL